MYPIKLDGKPDFSQVVPCHCQSEIVDRAREERMLRLCKLPRDTESWTFENFKPHNDSLKQAYVAAVKVSDPDGDIKWLTLTGGVDVGKSHLSVAICRSWLLHRKPARYVFVPSLLEELRAGYDSDSEYSFQSKLEFFKNVRLLVLDDLGTEKTTEWAFEKLISIINYRYEEGLHLVVTTNKALNELSGDDEHRIASRLLRHTQGMVVNIEAPEYRTWR